MSEKKLIERNPFGGTELKKPNAKPVQQQPVDILAGLVEKKPEAGAYSIYLDTDVVAAIDDLAKKADVSRSKAINTMLRNLLDL